MVTVFQAQGLSVVIFTNDHEPAHVHVFGDGEAKINLIGPGDRPELIWATEMTRADVRRALMIVTAQSELLLARWRDIHG